MSSEVPQGTVLGLFLFLLYINDILTRISPGTSLKHFAEDAMLYPKKKNNHNLQHDLGILTDSEQSWQITFNHSICEVMHITRSKQPIDNPYTIHDETLRAVPVATRLGINLSNNLFWNPHINEIVNKANNKLGFNKRNLKSMHLSYDRSCSGRRPQICVTASHFSADDR